MQGAVLVRSFSRRALGFCLAPVLLVFANAPVFAQGGSTPPAASTGASIPATTKLFTDDIVVAPDGLATHTLHAEVQANILAAAQSLGQAALPFDESTGRPRHLRGLYAQNRWPQIARSPTQPSTPSYRRALPSFPCLMTAARKVIVFPDVQAGDSVVYTAVWKEKKSALPGQVLISMPFSRLAAYDEARVTVTAPKSLPLFLETHELGFEKQETADSVIYRWHYSAPVPPCSRIRQVLSSFDRSPRAAGFELSQL